MFRILVAGVVAVVFAAPALAEKIFFCAADQATGFKYQMDQDRWEQTRFNVQDEKYVLRPLTEEELWDEQIGTYGMFKVGKDTPEVRCTTPPHEWDDGYIRMSCDYFSSSMIFNSETLNYMVTFVGGYVYGPVEGRADTPYIEIGRCTSLG